jgi:hypothetical protein
VASDFDDLIFTIFRGREAYISASGLHGLRLIKNLTSSRASRCEEKSMRKWKSNDEGSFIIYEAFVFTK